MGRESKGIDMKGSGFFDVLGGGGIDGSIESLGKGYFFFIRQLCCERGEEIEKFHGWEEKRKRSWKQMATQPRPPVRGRRSVAHWRCSVHASKGERGTFEMSSWRKWTVRISSELMDKMATR